MIVYDLFSESNYSCHGCPVMQWCGDFDWETLLCVSSDFANLEVDEFISLAISAEAEYEVTDEKFDCNEWHNPIHDLILRRIASNSQNEPVAT